MSLRRHRRAFAFIELLVVLVIGSVLYVLALGPVRSYLEAKRVTGCAENMRKLHLVMGIYANEHNGAFPKADGARTSSEVFARLVPQYSSDPAVFTCPASRLKKHYALVAGLTKDDSAPLVAEGPSFHGQGTGNVLMTDGSLHSFQPGASRMPSLPPHAQLLEPSP